VLITERRLRLLLRAKCKITLRKDEAELFPHNQFSLGMVVGGPATSGVGFIRSMTPIERHAELVYAECIMQKSVLGMYVHRFLVHHDRLTELPLFIFSLAVSIRVTG